MQTYNLKCSFSYRIICIVLYCAACRFVLNFICIQNWCFLFTIATSLIIKNFVRTIILNKKVFREKVSKISKILHAHYLKYAQVTIVCSILHHSTKLSYFYFKRVGDVYWELFKKNWTYSGIWSNKKVRNDVSIAK